MSRKNMIEGMERYKKYGRVLLGILLFGVFCIFCIIPGNSVAASSASISVQAREEKLVKGETVYVLVTVSSMDDIYGFEGYFKYDSRYLKFISGGKLVHGNDDAFHIQDVERSSGTNKIVYSIKFRARKAGGTSVELKKPYHVLGKDNAKMSVSYDAFNILIVEKEAQTTVPSSVPTDVPEKQEEQKTSGEPMPSEKPDQTDPPHKKGDVIGSVDLKKLSVTGVDLTPAFSSDIKRYSGTLNTSDKTADIKYKAADSLAKVTIKGNDALQDGKNVIKIVVKNGDQKKTYRVTLHVKLLKGMDKTSANKVTAEKVKEKIYLSGNLTVEAGTVESEEMLPDGFQEVKVSIDGKEVTGYAYGGEEDQGYFLIYDKNTQSFYVYDEEKNQLLPYEQVKNWYRSMGGQDFSELEKSEKKLQSYQYVLGIMGSFSGLMFILMLFFALHRKRTVE